MLHRILALFDATLASINFDMQRIKFIFVANFASNESVYTPKR